MATAAEIQTAYKAIYRTDLNATVAQAIAASGITVDAYVAQQLPQVASTTQAAVAIASFITGTVPTSDRVDALKVEADKQVASYTALGVGNPQLGAYEAFGRSFATDASTTAGFNTKYGALSTADFIGVVYAQVYGTQPSAAAAANLTAQINYFTNLYTTNGVANAALAAKGAVLGQIVGYAFTSAASANSNLDNQVQSLLTSAAKGDTTVYNKALPTVVDPGQVGASINLTSATGADVVSPTSADPAFKSTANNDTINGVVGGTLVNTTKIDGGAGDDTLNASSAGAYAPGAGIVTSIETINYKTTGVASIDVSNITGLKTIALDAGSNAAATFTKVSADTLVSIKATDVAATLSLDYVGTNTVTTANLAVSSVAAGAVTFNDTSVKTVNVTTSGTASGLSFGADQVETITVKGAGTYTQGTTGTALKTFDASGVAGAVTVDLSGTALTNKAVFTLGAASDTISIQANKAHTVTLGGGNDTVTLKVDAIGNLTVDDVATAATLNTALLTVTDLFAGATKDTLRLDGASAAPADTRAVLTQTQLDAAFNAADLKAAVTGVAAATTGPAATADDFAFFAFQGSTYVYHDAGNNGLGAGDALIKLTGVTLDQLVFTGATQNVFLV